MSPLSAASSASLAHCFKWVRLSFSNILLIPCLSQSTPSALVSFAACSLLHPFKSHLSSLFFQICDVIHFFLWEQPLVKTLSQASSSLVICASYNYIHYITFASAYAGLITLHFLFVAPLVCCSLPVKCGVRFPRLVVGLVSLRKQPQIFFEGQGGIHQDN